MKQRIFNLETLKIVHTWTIGADCPVEAFQAWCLLAGLNPCEYGHAED